MEVERNTPIVKLHEYFEPRDDRGTEGSLTGAPMPGQGMV